MNQRILVGGPNDGTIVSIAGALPPQIVVAEGQYVSRRLSPRVVVYGWTPNPPDRWTRRRREMIWGVPKPPRSRVQSSR